MKTFLLTLSGVLAFIWLFTSTLMVKAKVQTSPRMPLEETLKAYQWQKRVVLLCASSARQADFVHQKAMLAKDEAGLQERDIQVMEISYDQLDEPDKTFLREKLVIPINAFTVVLIGKDGGVKLKQSMPIAMEALISTIDAMPMRRQEMRKN